MTELKEWLKGLLWGILLGVSFMKAFPPKNKHDYNIACLDGQISIMEMVYKNKPLKTCDEMNPTK